MKILKVLVVGMFLGIVAGAVAGVYVYGEAMSFLQSTPSSEHEQRIVSIPMGSSPTAIARILEAEGLVSNGKYFTYLVRYEKVASKLKAGEFEFFTDMTPETVLKVLVDGKVVNYKVTIPEGYRITEMGPVVDKIPFLNGAHFVELALSAEIATKLGVGGQTLEGYLFPDTYLLTRQDDEEALIARMVGRFEDVWTEEFDKKAQEWGLSKNEVASLASVIEKETGAAQERPLIGSVFHNRIKLGMKLQSDPTIIYGLKNYDGDIRRKDIREPHPWNTYVIKGIPPTPIASPGEQALRAALWPSTSDYLYFVSKNDGTHYFSKTYAEHSRMVVKYQLGR